MVAPKVKVVGGIGKETVVTVAYRRCRWRQSSVRILLTREEDGCHADTRVVQGVIRTIGFGVQGC